MTIPSSSLPTTYPHPLNISISSVCHHLWESAQEYLYVCLCRSKYFICIVLHVYLTIRSYSSFSSNNLQYVSNTFWHAYFKPVHCCVVAVYGGDSVGWTATSVQIGQYMCRCKSSILPLWKFNSIYLPIYSILVLFILVFISFNILFLFFSFFLCSRIRIVNSLRSLYVKINFRAFFRFQIFYESSIPMILRGTFVLCSSIRIRWYSFFDILRSHIFIFFFSFSFFSFSTKHNHKIVESQSQADE